MERIVIKHYLKSLFFMAMVVASCSIFAQTCDCIPLLYEGFDYPEGDNIHQKVGGTGWADAWASQTGDQREGFRIGTNSLFYSNLRSNYKSFIGGQYWHLVGRPLDARANGQFAAYRKSNGLIGQAGTTLWTSAVFQKTQNNDEQTWFGVHNSNVSWYHGNDGSGVQKVLFGYFGAANSNTSGVRYWTVRVHDNYYQTTVPIQTATPVFVVTKFEFLANSTVISVFIDPSNLGSGTPPSVPAWTFTTSTALELRHFAAYGDNNTNNFILDEIRFATNYRCVAPDAAVGENLLPVARMTASAITGVAPLTVNFNGTTSTDPDGTLSNYEWTFGDGGTRTGATTSYTFNNTGIMYARLKVTDNCGSTNSVSQNLTITNANGQISCQSTPVVEAFPNCAGTGSGILRVDAGLGTNFSLTHQNGTNYPLSSSRFSNLPIGSYTLTVTGQSGCTETFNLFMPADSMNCANVRASGNFAIGMGLEGLSYWDKARAFKDFMKTSDTQILTFSVTNGGWNTNLQSEIPLDTEGYPTVVPFNTSQGQQRARIVLSAGGHLPMGDYVFLYDGQGSFTFEGAIQTLTSTQGRKTIRVQGTDNLWLDIQSSTQGNHLRNFRLVRPEHEGNYAIQPFYEPFLNRICQFNPIRFMDWQLTNASKLVNWSDRGKPNDRSQTMRNGISYEYIIDLANTANRDIWVCVPHQATDDFIQNMARLFRDRLKPNINVFLEYSNEVWNWQFEQAHWVGNNGNQNISYPRRYAERALNTFRIWHTEWAGQTQRVKRVLATQTGYNWVSQEMLAQVKGAFDYFSPTFYFGYGGSCLDNLRSLGTSATVTDVINCTRTSMRSFFPNISQTYRLAQLYGKPIAHYEGGQHMTSNPTIEPFKTALYASQIDPQIRTLYQEMMDSLRRYGGTTHATAFVLTGVRESRYGSWGHIEDIDQNTNTQAAPKYQVLLDNMGAAQGNCNLNFAILPLELLNFNGNTEGGKNVLKWQTEHEMDVSHFDIERSFDGLFFEKIGELKALNKNSFYTFTDNFDLSPITYYRLKINELDGKFVFSKTISIEKAPSAGLGAVKIYPSLTSGLLTIENAKSFDIINSIGQLVLREKGGSGNFQSFPNLSHLPSAIYLVKGVDTEGAVFSQKIIKN
ncbi:MAG: PKD domain-containing protein [Saprospiraceae bacterium]|nr:PKD domain-containing protein [Saprospiraceae bacterium]